MQRIQKRRAGQRQTQKRQERLRSRPLVCALPSEPAGLRLAVAPAAESPLLDGQPPQKTLILQL